MARRTEGQVTGTVAWVPHTCASFGNVWARDRHDCARRNSDVRKTQLIAKCAMSGAPGTRQETSKEQNTMPMKNPPHPGRSIRSACLEPLGLSVTEGAEVLGVTRQTLNNVIHGKSGISPQMAIRLSKAFGSTPETWLRMQLCSPFV